MSLAFRYDARAWSDPRVRWTIATIAPLLDAPWTERAPGAGPRGETGSVFIGDPAGAPDDAVAVIPAGDWPEWKSASLERVDWNGVPLAVPGGVLEASRSEWILPRQWLPAIWHAMAREEEREDSRRDQWGCYSGTFTRLGTIGLLEVPWVNLAVDRLRARIDAACAIREIQLERVPRWKNGAPYAVALSHDVDDVRLRSLTQAFRLLALARSPGGYAMRAGVRALARVFLPRPGETGPQDVYSQFERWAAEVARRGCRTTFFAVARPASAHEYDPLYALGDSISYQGQRCKVGEVFRKLRERGFEIGLHGSYESWRSAERLGEQRAAVAAAVGAEVRSTRQHFLRLDLDQTWDAQEEAGLETDATLGYNEAVGFRAGIAAPFHPWDAKRGAGRGLLEVPLTLMDGALFRGLNLAPDAARKVTLAHLDSVEKVGGMAGLLWHPNVAAEALYPGWWKCFTVALERLAARGAWVTSVGEIAAWWRERSARLMVRGS